MTGSPTRSVKRAANAARDSPADRETLVRLAARCDAEGFTHSGVADGPTGAVMDVTDPDGTVLRFYHFTAPTDGFTGVVFGDGGVETDHYATPRLAARTRR